MKRCVFLLFILITSNMQGKGDIPDGADIEAEIKTCIMDTAITQLTSFGISYVRNSATSTELGTLALAGAAIQYTLGYIYGQRTLPVENFSTTLGYILNFYLSLWFASDAIPPHTHVTYDNINDLQKKLYTMLDETYHDYVTNPNTDVYSIAAQYVYNYTELKRTHEALEQIKTEKAHLEQDPILRKRLPNNAQLEQIAHSINKYNKTDKKLHEKQTRLQQLNEDINKFNSNIKKLRSTFPLSEYNDDEQAYTFAFYYVQYYDNCKRLENYNEKLITYNTLRYAPWITAALCTCKAAGLIHGCVTQQ